MTPSILKEIAPWEWPPAAREVIKNALRDRSDESERMAATEVGGDLVVMDDEMADLLLSILANADEAEDLRARAAIALGAALEEADTQGYDDELDAPAIGEDKFEQIKETLRTLYAGEGLSKDVRRRVLEASVRAPEDWHTEAIRAAAASDDDEWRLTAVFGMRWLPGFEDEILEMLESPDPEIYYEAVRAAGDQAVEGAWPHVATLLASEETDKVLLLAAIEAAPAVNREEAESLLAPLLEHEDEDIAAAASDAVAMTHFEDYTGDDDEEGDVDIDEDDGAGPHKNNGRP